MKHEEECPSIFDDESIPCICREIRAAFDRGYMQALEDANVSLDGLMELQKATRVKADATS